VLAHAIGHHTAFLRGGAHHQAELAVAVPLRLGQVREVLEQARLTRVLAARDLEVTRLRGAFLKDLPVTVRR